MGKTILDTNILIEISRNNQEIINKVSIISPEEIYITAVIYSEFMRGIKNKELLTPYLQFLNRFNMLYSSKESDLLMLEIFKEYSLSYRPAIADMQIAAICVHHNASLYTLNTKDFTFVPDLIFFNTAS